MRLFFYARSLLTLLTLMISLQGCNSAPKTTRMQGEDILETTVVVADSLQHSLFLSECQLNDTPIRLSYQKAENQSMDMFRPSEQWLFVEKVIGSVPVQELKSKYNITTVRSAEKMNDIATLRNRDVTHLMTAIVTTVTRDVYKDRTDAYKCQYEILNLSTNEVVWSDSYEIKRVASGISWD